ncbi:MAG: sugar phosphate isomerase/epimerase [Lachnospiraceae bacterium]|uniref:sugar phosphate isomerase/epimerase family protein n=1 Tax=Clostridium sp. (strain SY8519) TaxID=1042156 RepID=UPI0002D6D166|nr:TIM barrel protein [Clostridium sp. SY8519]MCI1655331.1 sugar phosphate isomerase/epimerase [Lachnospiraceae bacterium]MCI1657650.1 sugar phosphate isomerase/epimerase [Lachnospiraceae bacterium]MCI2196065.1 sugar phosphate isomerase/epimerase [Lachnospiraceae bacterium]
MDAERKIKRGVAIYSYSGEYGRTMNLEDCFKDMYDMGATGVEILANSHIDSYPDLSDDYLAKWNALCRQYQIEPVEYGHWIDNRLYKNRMMSVEEASRKLVNDFRIAHALGFRILRTKMGVIDDQLAPVENWREIIRAVLPKAEKYDVVMCPEIHLTTVLADQFVTDYVDFIQETGTEHFGLNIDLSVFQNRFDVPGVVVFNPDCKHSQPEEIIPLLPYVKCIHAKFNKMDDSFRELTIPYPEIIKVLQDNGWEGYLLSEYEGANKDVPGYVSQELRKQHVMLKRLLGY